MKLRMKIMTNDEMLLKKAFLFGAEANENDFTISEYFEDFCILLKCKNFHLIDPELRQRIREEFKRGEIANKEKAE